MGRAVGMDGDCNVIRILCYDIYTYKKRSLGNFMSSDDGLSCREPIYSSIFAADVHACMHKVDRPLYTYLDSFFFLPFSQAHSSYIVIAVGTPASKRERTKSGIQGSLDRLVR